MATFITAYKRNNFNKEVIVMKVYVYTQPELNILCYTLLPEAIPEGVEAIEFEVEDPSDIILDKGQIRLKTEQEKLDELKQEKLNQLKQYIASLLSPTDYIIIKISEVQALGNTQGVANLKQRYANQLAERGRIRAWSEQVKQAIKNAKSIQELNSISITYED